MGADIHMYVEYRSKKRAQEDQKQGRKPHWISYGDRTNPGRNYTLFGILAGVRGQYEDSFEPKGMVDREEMGWASRGDAYMFIVDRPGEEIHEEGCCSREDAERWTQYGCQIIEDKWIEHPDWHSHSWMSIEELEEAFRRYKEHATAEWREPVHDVPLEYRALLASMKALEDGGENEVRVVFWFDN
jgi:hypothetical protein